MQFSSFFIKRPYLSGAFSIFILFAGILSYFSLPVSLFPEIVPPTIVVTARMPGASPQVLMDSVISPLEQEINGVEGMSGLQSLAASDGTVTITVTFDHGADDNLSQILVQNRVNQASTRLPEQVQRLGVTVKKRSADQLAAVHLYSTDQSRDTLFLTNFAITRMMDRLARIPGVSEIVLFGSREYSIRIWMDPDKLSLLKLSPTEIINKVQEQNREIFAGKINSPKLSAKPGSYELLITTEGRLKTPMDFENIIVKRNGDGRIVYLKDVASVELGSYNYDEEFYRDSVPAIGMGIYQISGSNALETMKGIKEELAQIEKELPEGVESFMTIDNTEFIDNTIRAVYQTLGEATLLVVLVILVFLHSWKSTLIPVLSIPISIIGSLAFLKLFGFSINTLTLFGLILATGIVVDDSIVIVEAIETKIKEGLKPFQAALQTMKELSGAIIGITLVLSCVFIPVAFLSGIKGEFYKQFALTIASSTVISAFVSLTLSPALCARVLTDKEHSPAKGKFALCFDRVFERLSGFYSKSVGFLLGHRNICLLSFVCLLGLTAWLYMHIPTGFIPRQDNGYLSVSLQLADGLALDKTDEAAVKAQKVLSGVDGVEHYIVIAGQSGATRAKSSNSAVIIVKLSPKPERIKKGLTLPVIMGNMDRALKKELPEANIHVLAPPTVMGVGAGGDFQFMVQDKGGLGIRKLIEETQKFTQKLSQSPVIGTAFTSFRALTPQLELEIDRDKAAVLNIDMAELSNTIQYQLGSVYVNDFNLLNRVFRVVAQADPEFRNAESDIDNLWVKSETGDMVPLSSVAKVKRTTGSEVLSRFNMYPSVAIMGNLGTGHSIGEAIMLIEEMAAQELPDGMGIEWTDLIRQQKLEQNSDLLIFFLCLFFVFVSLAALYENLRLPFIIILTIPLVFLFGLLGLKVSGLDNNLLSQIGFIVLIGLSCKNSILMVEKARQLQESGLSSLEAIKKAALIRFRPILMTSLAFVFGVMPLAFSAGYGSELRQALGITVFCGMIGVTVVCLIFTPLFYKIFRP